MFVWSKRFAITALVLFAVIEAFLISQTRGGGPSGIHPHTIQYILANYSLLAVWAFIWMYDQAKVRGTPHNTGKGLEMALRLGARQQGL